jgi:hypothetical protein
MKKLIFITSLILLAGCTRLDSFQLGKVKGDLHNYQKFEIKVNEVGINIGEAAEIAKLFASKKQAKQIDAIRDIIEMFQMGPKTGNPTFNDTWTNGVAEAILTKCPSGVITGLTSIREMNEYPVFSGEIVKIIGYCQKDSTT